MDHCGLSLCEYTSHTQAGAKYDISHAIFGAVPYSSYDTIFRITRFIKNPSKVDCWASSPIGFSWPRRVAFVFIAV